MSESDVANESGDEEGTTLLDIAVAEGFTLFTIRMLEYTLQEALSLAEDCSQYLCSDDISEDAQKSLHDMMLASYDLILQQLRNHGKDIWEVLGPDKADTITFINQATSIEDVMKFEWDALDRVDDFIQLAVKMYEDNLYSLSPQDRMLPFTIRLVQRIHPKDGPFNSQPLKEWMFLYPTKLTEIEIKAFESIIGELIKEYIYDIQNACKDMIRETLLVQFVKRIICEEPPLA